MLRHEYDEGMNVRITVSLPEELVAEANSAAATGRASSVSAYVAQALRDKSGRESLDDLLAELVAELGPATEEEGAWVRDALGIADE